VKRKRRRLRILYGCASIALLVVVVLALLLYRGSQYVPEFYEQALRSEPSPREQAELGDALEREALELRNDAQREGAWEAVFSDAQINAWLAHDLPRNHPRALPSNVSEPRVKITPDQVQLACKYEGQRLATVVSLSAEIHLTDKPNQLAIQIRSVRAGLIPLPLKNLLDQATEIARRSGLQLAWSQQEGDPVALLQIPSQIDGKTKRPLQVETLELREGEIYVAGHTGGPESE
jgi:hypothetical protein